MTPSELPATILSAWQQRTRIVPLSVLPADLGLEAAFRMQDHLLDLIAREGGVMTGGKIGLSDRHSLAALGLDQPVSGLLFRHMRLDTGHVLAAPDYAQPRVEGEICLTLSADLDREDLTEQEVAAAIATVAPAIEIIDSRWQDWTGSIPAVVAENIAASYYVCGQPVALPDMDQLASLEMHMTVDGKVVASGDAQAAYGSPVKALHWLACNLARRGRPLKAGHQVMSGAFARMHPVQSGQHVTVEFPGIGAAEITFG